MIIVVNSCEHLGRYVIEKSYDVCFIFRINTKQVASNVALRRQVFESKSSADSSWRCSMDDKLKDLKDNNVVSSETSSLSAEPFQKDDSINIDKMNAHFIKKERPKPVRENSYLTAVRSSPDAPVVLRPKSQTHHRMPSEEDNRKTRRTSYLKATANEEFPPLVVSDTDAISTTTAQDDDDPQQLKGLVSYQLVDVEADISKHTNSSYSRWTAPKFTVDIQFLRRIFEEPQTTLVASSSVSSSETNSISGRFFYLFTLSFQQPFLHKALKSINDNWPKWASRI